VWRLGLFGGALRRWATRTGKNDPNYCREPPEAHTGLPEGDAKSVAPPGAFALSEDHSRRDHHEGDYQRAEDLLGVREHGRVLLSYERLGRKFYYIARRRCRSRGQTTSSRES